MALIKKKELAKMDDKTLKERRDEFKLELSRDLANSEVGGSVKSPGRIGELRTTLARIEQRLSQIRDKKKKDGSKEPSNLFVNKKKKKEVK